MDSYLAGAVSAVWLGILTSISPCPLATNITAISYIGRQGASPARTLAAGLMYTAGRSVAYIALSLVIVASLLSVPEIARALQKYINLALGPLLIVVGLVLLDAIRLPSFGYHNEKVSQSVAGRFGSWSASLLGVLFALSFCPVSAALFFGSLIPLATREHAPFLYPVLYGMGTAVPVVGAAVLLAFGAQTIGRFYQKLTAIEKIVRRLTSLIFIVVGVYFILLYWFGINL